MSLCKLAISQRLPKGLNSGVELADSPANRLGAWTHHKVMPTLMGPLYRSTKDIKVNDVSIPGWANSMATGGLVGAGLGGLIGAFSGNAGKGALIGGGLGSLGLGGLGFMLRNKDWSSKIPFVGGLFKDKFDFDNAMEADENAPLDRRTTEEQEEDLLKENHVKIAYGLSSSNDVIAKIYRDTELTLRQKQELANQVQYLNAQQTRRLNQLVGGAMGGGVGYLVAKYLLGLGKFGTLLTTIVSGLASARGAGGAPPKSPYDNLGRPYYM